MRLAIAIVLAILAINLSDGSVLAQTSDEPSWLLSLHMFDAQTGWAVSAQGWGGAFSRGAVGSIVRTTDGGLHWKVVADAGEVRAITPAGVSSEEIFHAIDRMEFHLSSLIIENGSAGGSSSGRTTGSEPVSGGSNPPPPAIRLACLPAGSLMAFGQMHASRMP